jgi:hypothetical protein
MVHERSILVTLITLVDLIPMPMPPKRRGRPWLYPDRLFLKALVIMIVRRLTKVHTLLTVLDQPTDEMRELRALLTENGRYPSRRTFERRLKAIPETLPAQIGCLGRCLAALILPWRDCARAAAIDSTILRACGGVWHKKHREAGIVPHTSIDTEAHWTKSGWHGWVYGWKLHLVTSAAAVWIPLAARLTSANAADNEEAPALIKELPTELRFLLGDVHYLDAELERLCEERGIILVTSHNTKGNPYPHTDPGVEVRRVLHKTRSLAIENFNEQFKGIFDGHASVPTRGLCATRRFVLGAVFVYQLTLLYQYLANGDLRVGLKAFIKAA